MFKNLRKLYGRASNGSPNRRNIKITITPETMELVEMFVDFGKGKYGSALFELAVRLLLVLSNDGEDIEMMSIELQKILNDVPRFARNLRLLAKYLEA